MKIRKSEKHEHLRVVLSKGIRTITYTDRRTGKIETVTQRKKTKAANDRI